MSEPIRVLVVEDEPLGAARLTDLLDEQEGVVLIGVAEEYEQAVAMIRDARPDLVFLDIQMPGGSGIEVVRQVGPEEMPVTVFVTAYDRYALEAFQLAAVDYLLKPYSDERFEEAFHRASRKVRLEELAKMRVELTALVEGAAGSLRSRYLERIPVHARGKTRVVPVGEILYITASGVYAELHTAEGQHLIRESLQTLEEQLDPAVFMRVHRSAIVRLAEVAVLHRAAGGAYRVELRCGAKLRVARSRRAELEGRLMGGGGERVNG